MMNSKIGSLEIIFGSMFSGKSEEMMRRLRRREIAGQKFMLFKPAVDTRYNVEIKTHDGRISMTTEIVQNAAEILSKVSPSIEVVGIDETQFFDTSLIPVVNKLIQTGKRVICTGLDMWASGEAIEIMGMLSCIADEVTKLKAVCITCGNDAYLSQRKNDIVATVDIGGADKYTVVCRDCLYKQA